MLGVIPCGMVVRTLDSQRGGLERNISYKDRYVGCDIRWYASDDAGPPKG